MTTAKQLEANRINAMSAGVKTQSGKDVVRHNAFKHGLTANALLSDLKTITESHENYLEIVDGLIQSLNPRNSLEDGFIEAMAKAQFKLKRCDVAEAGQLQDDDAIFSITPRVNKLEIKDPAQFELILKYKQSLESQFYRALDGFYRSRQAKQMDLFLQNGDFK